MNITDTIEPKVDQLTADHLIGRTMTIRITAVHLAASEQPCEIHYEGENGLPYRPGKSMRRVLVHAWGGDVNKYVGRAMRLYRDDDVQFGGLKVGGVRISHMSHITAPLTMALTAKKGSKKAFKVLPLAEEKPAAEKPPAAAIAEAQATEAILAPSGALVQVPVGRWLAAVARALAQLEDAEAVRVWRQSMGQHIAAVCERDDAMAMEADRMISERIDALAPAAEPADADADDSWPGPKA